MLYKQHHYYWPLMVAMFTILMCQSNCQVSLAYRFLDFDTTSLDNQPQTSNLEPLSSMLINNNNNLNDNNQQSQNEQQQSMVGVLQSSDDVSEGTLKESDPSSFTNKPFTSSSDASSPALDTSPVSSLPSNIAEQQQQNKARSSLEPSSTAITHTNSDNIDTASVNSQDHQEINEATAESPSVTSTTTKASDNIKGASAPSVASAALSSIGQILMPRRTHNFKTSQPGLDGERARSTSSNGSSSSVSPKSKSSGSSSSSSSSQKLASEEAIIKLHYHGNSNSHGANLNSFSSTLSSKRDDKVTKMHNDIDQSKDGSTGLTSILSSRGLVKAMTDNRLARTMSTIGKSLAGNKYVTGAATASAAAALGYAALTKLLLNYKNGMNTIIPGSGYYPSTTLPFIERNSPANIGTLISGQTAGGQFGDLVGSASSPAPSFSPFFSYTPSSQYLSVLPQEYSEQQQSSPDGYQHQQYTTDMYQQQQQQQRPQIDVRAMQQVIPELYIMQQQHQQQQQQQQYQPKMEQFSYHQRSSSSSSSPSSNSIGYDQSGGVGLVDQMQTSPSTMQASYSIAPVPFSSASAYYNPISTVADKQVYSPQALLIYPSPAGQLSSSSSAVSSSSSGLNSYGYPSPKQISGDKQQVVSSGRRSGLQLRVTDEKMKNQLLKQLSALPQRYANYPNTKQSYFVTSSPIQQQQQTKTDTTVQQRRPDSDTINRQQQTYSPLQSKSTSTITHPMDTAVNYNKNYYQIDPSSPTWLSDLSSQSSLSSNGGAAGGVSNYENNKQSRDQMDNQSPVMMTVNQDNENLEIDNNKQRHFNQFSSSSSLPSIDSNNNNNNNNKFTPMRSYKSSPRHQQHQQQQQIVKLKTNDDDISSSSSLVSSEVAQLSRTGTSSTPLASTTISIDQEQQQPVVGSPIEKSISQ